MYAIKRSLLSLLFISLSCNNRENKTVYYKNIDTGKVLNEADFAKYRQSLHEKYYDSLKITKINFSLKKEIISTDSLIRPYQLDVRVGKKYIISSSGKEKIFSLIGRKIPNHTLRSLANGEKDLYNYFVNNNKLTLINFWFINCKPCVQEIPDLNRLKNKFSEDVNFISITFDSGKKVSNFLKDTPFDFKHYIEADSFISLLGIKAFPKNVFLDRNGNIEYIEDGLSYKEFNFILEEILQK